MKTEHVVATPHSSESNFLAHEHTTSRRLFHPNRLEWPTFMFEEETIRVYDSQSELYHTAFETFLQHTDQKTNARDWLERFIALLPQRRIFIDAGAGTGQLTSWLIPQFTRTIALEPNAYLRSEFQKSCPGIKLLAEPITEASPSALADLVLCSHVFYYIQPDEWLRNLETMLSWVNPLGVVLVALQNSRTDCMKMVHHFLGMRFDLMALGEKLQHTTANDYAVTLDTVPAHISTPDFDSAYVAAEFILNLLPITTPPTRKALEEYVSKSFVDPHGGYRFSCHQDFLQVQRKT